MDKTFTAFRADRRLADGPLDKVLDGLPKDALVFDDETGELVKLNTAAERQAALSPCGPATRVSPITVGFALLPRHLAWLEAQPGAPAATLRRLIDAARRSGEGADRRAKAAAYKFMTMVGGDLPGFEEATRALFVGDVERFDAATPAWPKDLADYARRLAADAFKVGTLKPPSAAAMSPPRRARSDGVP